MQPQRSLWKLLIISFFAFLVVACKPIASFSVSPNPVKAGVEATFDASASIAYITPKNNALKSYAWDFGDGAMATGKTAKHTYAAAGTFKVKLTVIDTAGRKGEATESLVVTAGDVVAQTTTLKVITQIAGGVSLTGAEVTVGTASGTSDANGLATLGAAPVGENQVVTVKKAGYITQVVRKTLAADTADQQMLVLLMPEKDTLSVAAIESAQTIKSNYLGASVTLPANAFVNAATGAPAVGAATLKLTPWDISGIDLQAMPGNGRALDASGALVDLISAGMMSVEFTDAAGNKLQVAAGKTADIQMDLPAGTTSIGGHALSVGSAIPMWHFDESQGLWVEEGTGSVVATATGLAVKATVSHFTIWNWDYVTVTISGGSSESGGSVSVPPDATSLNLSCVNSSGVLVACNVFANIIYPDGSLRTWSASLRAAVTAIRNIPGNPTIVWVGTTADGDRGTVTSGVTGTAVIQISPPNVTNFVRCVAPTGVATPCTATMAAPLADGTAERLTRYIPAEGANINLTLDTTGPLSWTASTGFATNGGTWTRYNGEATSGLTGSVDIPLVAEVINSGKTVLVSCRPNTYEGVLLGTCEVEINIRIRDGGTLVDTITVQGLNGPASVTLPELPEDTLVSFSASGTAASGPSPFPLGDYFSTTLGNLSNNQSIELVLIGMRPTE